jgi:hypothetical protein
MAKARWLLVKVTDVEYFDNQYRLNQLEGVDCMEVTPAQLATQDASLMAFLTDGGQT